MLCQIKQYLGMDKYIPMSTMVFDYLPMSQECSYVRDAHIYFSCFRVQRHNGGAPPLALWIRKQLTHWQKARRWIHLQILHLRVTGVFASTNLFPKRGPNPPKMHRIEMTLCQKDVKPFSASIGHKQLASKLNTWVHFEDYQKVSSMYRKLSLRTC